MKHTNRCVTWGRPALIFVMTLFLLAEASPAQMRGGVAVVSPTRDTGLPFSARTGETIVLGDPGNIYNAKTPTNWVGSSVTLRNVLVQDTASDGNFWVGADADHRLLVIRGDDPALTAMLFQKGDVVIVTGLVNPASSYIEEATSASEPSLKEAEQSSGVVLLAEQITIASSAQRE